MQTNHKTSQITFRSNEDLNKTITEKGSLGLLAYGYRGLLMWRKKRNELSKSEGKDIEQK